MSKPNKNGVTMIVIMAVVAIGFVAAYNYTIFLKRQNEKPALPHISRLTSDLEVVRQDGQTVQLAALKGKVLLVSQVYTRCQQGCAKVTQELKAVMDEFASEPLLQAVSFSLDNKIDPPEALKAYAENFGITPDRWWMVAGDTKEVRNWMDRQVKFKPTRDIPVEDRLNESDIFDHDLRIALVDDSGHVRGFYGVAYANADWATAEKEKLRQDLKAILKEAKAHKVAVK